jgi:hypothetical protein
LLLVLAPHHALSLAFDWCFPLSPPRPPLPLPKALRWCWLAAAALLGAFAGAWIAEPDSPLAACAQLFETALRVGHFELSAAI